MLNGSCIVVQLAAIQSIASKISIQNIPLGHDGKGSSSLDLLVDANRIRINWCGAAESGLWPQPEVLPSSGGQNGPSEKQVRSAWYCLAHPG